MSRSSIARQRIEREVKEFAWLSSSDTYRLWGNEVEDIEREGTIWPKVLELIHAFYSIFYNLFIGTLNVNISIIHNNIERAF